jgi:hypothetical protein
MKKLAWRSALIVHNLSRLSPPPAGERISFARKNGIEQNTQKLSFPGTEQARKDEYLQLTPWFNGNISAPFRVNRSYKIPKLKV